MISRLDRIGERLLAWATEDTFSGVVAVSLGGRELFSEAFGFRDIANRLENTPETRFGIASGTKIFTALTILRLVEAGELSLDTTVGSIVGNEPGFVHADATISQLLCHTSGIYDYYDEELITDFENFTTEIPWSQLQTPSDYLPLFTGKRMKYRPGERSSYSNGAYVFLGIIIEQVTHGLYRDAVNREVLEPAGMDCSGFYAFNELPANTATGYLCTEGSGRSNIYQLPIRGGGDGGMYTTASDLTRFWDRMFGGQILRPDLVETMCRKWSILWNSAEYGLGVYRSRINGNQAYFITGSDAGVGFRSCHVPRTGLSIHVLSNTTDGNVPLTKRILETLGA